MKVKIVLLTLFLVTNGLYANVSLTADAEMAVKSAALVALQASRLALIASKEAAVVTLKAFEKTSGLVIEGTRAVLKSAASSVITIEGMRAGLASEDVIDGKLFNIEVDLLVFGKKKSITGLIFDFKKPEDSLKNLVSQILEAANIFDF